MRYRQETAVTKDGYSRWVKPKKRGYRMACCDCGLVHEMQFKYERLGGRGVFIFFRARRHERATAAMRRGKKRT